jgi:uncharacterized protein
MPARWFREFMAFDPSVDLRRIECPVLAITGASDLQVEPGDVAEIGRLVQGPFEGRTPAGLTHVLRTHDGPPSLSSYRAQLEKPMDADLVGQVVAWIEAAT